MVVGHRAISVLVRSAILPNGQRCEKTNCRYYPNCQYRDMCKYAHGEEELKYWSGKPGILENTLGIVHDMI